MLRIPTNLSLHRAVTNLTVSAPGGSGIAAAGDAVVGKLPAPVLRGFRRKIFVLLALQLASCMFVALVFGFVDAPNEQLQKWLMGGADELAACRERPATCPARPDWSQQKQLRKMCEDAQLGPKGDTPFVCTSQNFWAYPCCACLVLLSALFCCRVAYPFNYALLAAFTVSEGLLVAITDYTFYSHVPYQMLGYTLVAIAALAFFSTRREHEGWPVVLNGGARAPPTGSLQLDGAGGDDETEELPDMLKAGVYALGASLLFAMLVQVAVQPGVWAHFIVVQFAVIILMTWVLYDAHQVEGKVGPDKYFVAVSMFYTDILVIAFACVFICFLTGPTAAEPVAAIDSGGDTS